MTENDIAQLEHEVIRFQGMAETQYFALCQAFGIEDPDETDFETLLAKVKADAEIARLARAYIAVDTAPALRWDDRNKPYEMKEALIRAITKGRGYEAAG